MALAVFFPVLVFEFLHLAAGGRQALLGATAPFEQSVHLVTVQVFRLFTLRQLFAEADVTGLELAELRVHAFERLAQGIEAGAPRFGFQFEFMPCVASLGHALAGHARLVLANLVAQLGGLFADGALALAEHADAGLPALQLAIDFVAPPVQGIDLGLQRLDLAVEFGGAFPRGGDLVRQGLGLCAQFPDVLY